MERSHLRGLHDLLEPDQGHAHLGYEVRPLPRAPEGPGSHPEQAEDGQACGLGGEPGLAVLPQAQDGFEVALQQAGAAGLDGPPLQPALQVLGQRRGRGIAALRLLLQALQGDDLQVAGHLGVVSAGWGRFLLQQAANDLHVGGRLLHERGVAAEELVEERAQTVDVRADVQGAVSLGLLRGHVGQGADDGGRPRLPGHVGEPRQPEVHEVGLQPPVHGLHHDVRGLQVPVHHALPVGCVQGQGDLDQEPHPGAEVVGAHPVQRLALHQLHGDEGQAVEGAGLIDLDDVLVVQAGLELGLQGQEAAAALVLLADELQGHHPVQLPVPGPVDLRHAALAQHLEHLVAVPGEQGGGDA